MAVPKYVATSSFETPASLPTDKLLHNNIHRTTGPSYDTPEDISRTGSVSTPHIPLKAPQEPAKFVRWGIHWQVPTQMVSLLVAGVALAAGHHVYYQSLVGTKVLPVDDTVSAWNTGRQEWKIRFGTAFAFFAKTCLASSIAIAYTQHIWATCRRKAYSISGLDAMFSATSDVFAFTSPDLTLRAKVGALLAALIWLLPLSALITPATLTVVSVRDSSTRSGQVPQLYFPQGSGAIVSDTSLEPDNAYTWSGVPSALLSRISFATASSMGILPMPPGTPNSTYEIDFYGPSLQCEEPNSKLLGVIREVVKTVNGSSLSSVYTAFTPLMDMYINDTTSSTDYPAFARDCVFGGYPCSFEPGSVIAGSNGIYWNISRADPLVISFGETSYTCALRTTSYSVRFRSSAEQSFLELMSSKWQDSDPSSDLIYKIFGMAIADILSGTYYLSNQHTYSSGNVSYLLSARTSIGATAIMPLINQAADALSHGLSKFPEVLAEDIALTRNKSLGELVEEFSRNLTLSFFSNTRMWSNITYTTNITYVSQINIYAYNAHNLWAAYGVAIAVTVVSLVIGFYALYSNGVSYRTSFSTIVATTRNHVLNEIIEGSSLGAEPARRDVLKTKLRFGVFQKAGDKEVGDERKEPGDQRAGFGLETQVMLLQKGQSCY